MTIIPKNINFVLEEIKRDSEGRYLIITGIFNDRKLSIVNFYAPTQDKSSEQLHVLNDLIQEIADVCHQLIWCGDFNAYLSFEDKYKNTIRKPTPLVSKILTLMEEHDLCDMWRILNPETKRYTWRRYTPSGISQSRLDYFIVPNALIYDVEECNILPSFLSDHNIISLVIKMKEQKAHGKGTWKFNTSLLKDHDYINKMNEILIECNNKYRDVNDKRLRWDVIKAEIRGFTISYSSYKKKCEKELETKLLHEIDQLEKEISINPDNNKWQQLVTAKSELSHMEQEKCRGIQIRANCLHIEANEHNTQYFLSREKSRAESKAMTTLITDSGQVLNDIHEISMEQKHFYQSLYEEKNAYTQNEINEARKYFLDSDEVCQISDEDREKIDSDISYDEIAQALKELPNNKTPGVDGIGPEYYKFFWPKLKHFVCDSLQFGIAKGELSIEQKRAILTLIPKKEKDSRYIKNWRPLSLLNTDYKIIAKLLAKRLQPVLPEIINTDQSGCIKNRSSFSNLRTTIDIMNFAREQNLTGIIAFIDFEKAFDTVNWKFLYSCLKKMNFGEFYINCVKTLYHDISTYISNCGFLSEPIKPTRGIRQGCPISANLFVIIVEMLATAIRHNNRINGIKIGNQEFKISQFADDTCIYIMDTESLKIVFHVLDLFAKCAGLKANRDKTQAIGIGCSSNYRHKLLGIKWPQGSVKCLGIYLNTDFDKMTAENYNAVLVKIENLIQLWCLRKLTLKGKILIVNTLLITQMLYICSVLHAPKWVIERYQMLIRDFIWDSKPTKVKYSCMISKIEEGGLKLQDIEAKITSLKVKWLHLMSNPEHKAAWKSYVETKCKAKIHDILLHNKSVNDLPSFKDNFYNEIFNLWVNLHHHAPVTSEQACMQTICNNTFIKIDGRVINDKICESQEIRFIQNLLDDNGNFAEEE
jgi:hypothetical protein